jgi:hypothetical protein
MKFLLASFLLIFISQSVLSQSNGIFLIEI